MANYGTPIEDRYVIVEETGCWEWIAANAAIRFIRNGKKWRHVE